MDNNTERNLQNALDAAKRRLRDLEDKYKTDATTQDKDFLEEDIEIEKANVAALEEKLEEIRKDKVDISFNNFEYALLLLIDNLHNENMCILHSLLKKEDANKVQEASEDNINRIFKNYLAIKRG